MMRILFRALVLMLMPTVALATGQIKLRSASGIGSEGTGCHVQQRTLTGGVIGWVMNCAPTDALDGFTLITNFPSDETTPALGFYLSYSSPDPTPSGNVCTFVCVGVVKDGQSFNDVDLTACFPFPLSEPQRASGVETLINPGVGITPKDTTDTPCVGHSCDNAELVIKVTRVNDDGNCPGHSAQSVDYWGFIVFYN